jgi:iron complex transport system substrate-binding protein
VPRSSSAELCGYRLQSTKRRRHSADDPRAGGLVGCADRAEALAARLELAIDAVREAASGRPRPRVFFEEWDNPLISGIRWVEELVEIAGGEPIFPELRDAKLGRDRIVTPGEVVRRNPDIIVASWCGRAVRKERIAARIGWDSVAAVRDGQIYEIKSAYILQPGPAALIEGLRQLHGILSQARNVMTWGDDRKH